MSDLVTTLCNEPEAFVSDLGDDQSVTLLVTFYMYIYIVRTRYYLLSFLRYGTSGLP